MRAVCPPLHLASPPLQRPDLTASMSPNQCREQDHARQRGTASTAQCTAQCTAHGWRAGRARDHTVMTARFRCWRTLTSRSTHSQPHAGATCRHTVSSSVVKGVHHQCTIVHQSRSVRVAGSHGPTLPSEQMVKNSNKLLQRSTGRHLRLQRTRTAYRHGEKSTHASIERSLPPHRA